MKFYILVPVYNVEEFVVDCIESVLRQTYTEWEMVIVDDGSTDSSGIICNNYALRDCRIKVIHQKNGGALSARQTARDYLLNTNLDKKDYVIFLDSDDLLENDALRTINNLIKSTGSDLIIYKYRRFNENENLPEIANRKYTFEIIENKPLLYKKVFKNASYNSLCRKAISVSLIEKTNYNDFFKVIYGEDLLQSIPLYKNAKRVLFTDAELYRYRMNPTSITHSITSNNYHVTSTVRKEVWDFLHKENVWNKKDYADYMQYCKYLLKNDIRMISGFKISKLNRYKFFNEILNDDYYQIVLGGIKRKDYMLSNLKNKHYLKVLFICKLYHIASTVKQFFKNNS